MIFTCPEASCSLSYAGVNLDRLQRHGNLSIYIRISGSSSVTGRNPLPFVPVLFLCGSAPQCPRTISAYWRRRWLLHPGETSHNLSHIKILPPFLSQEDSASSQRSAPSPCPCWGGLMESHGSQSPGAPWLGRGRAGDTTREAFGAAAPSGDGGSGRAGGSIPTPGCPGAAGPSRA